MSANDLIELSAHFENWKRVRAAGLDSDIDQFLYYVLEHFLRKYDLSDEELMSGYVDGGDDGGADGIYFFADEELVREDSTLDEKCKSVELVFFQVKDSESGFSPVAVDKLRLLTTAFLDISGARLEALRAKFNSRVLSAMSTFREKFPTVAGSFPAVSVRYIYVTRGDNQKPNASATESAEAVQQEVRRQLSRAVAAFEFVNAQDLGEEVRKLPVESRELVFTEQPIQATEGWIGLVSLDSYYNFMKDRSGALARRVFDSNVRGWQKKTAVNRDIQGSLEASPYNFWLLNNGITILASEAQTAGQKRLTVRSAQVVNGLQTSRAIYEYFSKGEAIRDARSILVRVILPNQEKPELREAVIRATNSQNKMAAASLRATDHIHAQIEEVFKQYDFYYDRRRGVHRDEKRPIDRIVSVIEVLQSVVAILLAKPDDARARPSDYFTHDSKYERVFDPEFPLVAYLKCYEIVRLVVKHLAALPLDAAKRRNLRYYIARDVAATVTSRVDVRPSDVLLVVVASIPNKTLEQSFLRVSAKFEALGGNDAVAKGPELSKWLRSNIKRRLVRKSSPS